MSRLDQHVSAVQRKLALDIFLRALAWGGLVVSIALLLGVMLRQGLSWPIPTILLWIGTGIAIAAALAWAMMRQPGQYEAAVAIDKALATKDKFATALYARDMADPMAQAAVRDAEQTADAVRVGGRFKLGFPKPSLGIPILLLLALLAQWYTPRDIFGKKAQEQKQQREAIRQQDAKQALAAAKVQIEQAMLPLQLAKSDAIKNALEDLERLQSAKDPARAKPQALDPLKRLDDAISKEIERNKSWSDAKNLTKTFSSLKTDNEKGPVAEAARDMASGQFDQALQQVQDATKNFDKMTPDEQKKTAEQMAKLAEQLKQMAEDPAVQEAIKQQAQSMGADPTQAGQLAQAMKNAASGDPDAQKQVEDMVKKISDQMNNGQGPTDKQKQAMDNLARQMQSQANAQSQAQQLSQAAQKMAGAMQSAGGAASQQQLADASKAVGDALGQMQAIQSDAQQLQAAQQAVRQQMQQMAQGNGEGDSAGTGGQQSSGQQAGGAGSSNSSQGQNNNSGSSSCNGNCQNQGNGSAQGGGVGQWSQGNTQNQGNGTGGPGMGSGTGIGKQLAPFQTQAVFSHSQDNDRGRNLASVYVQADTIKGESKQALRDVAAAQQRMDTDEVDTAHIDRRSQDAIQKYFNSMRKDAEGQP